MWLNLENYTDVAGTGPYSNKLANILCLYIHDLTKLGGFFFFFLKILFIYLFIHSFIHSWATHREQAPCKEPDVELDPGTPGSHPGLKAEA